MTNLLAAYIIKSCINIIVDSFLPLTKLSTKEKSYNQLVLVVTEDLVRSYP
jgi:hypothetical protein